MSNVPYHSSIVKNYKTYENSFLPKIVHIPIAQECDYEYKIVVNKLLELGFKNVFTQDFESAETIYTPDFSDKNSDFKF